MSFDYYYYFEGEKTRKERNNTKKHLIEMFGCFFLFDSYLKFQKWLPSEVVQL